MLSEQFTVGGLDKSSEPGEISYDQACQFARAFINNCNPEHRSDPTRAARLDELLELVTTVVRPEGEQLKAIVDSARYLLENDPFSVQEAGAIARYLALKKRPRSDLEYKLIGLGDWQGINDAFAAEGPDIWQTCVAGMSSGNKKIRLFRGMSLERDEVLSIQRAGMPAVGFLNYHNLEEMLEKYFTLHYSLKNPLTSDFEKTRFTNSFLVNFPITKVGVLRDVWRGEEFGTSSSSKLGISTTTLATLERVMPSISGFYGKHLFELWVESSRVVMGPHVNDNYDREKEYTVMGYIFPEEIVDCFHQKDGLNGLDVSLAAKVKIRSARRAVKRLFGAG